MDRLAYSLGYGLGEMFVVLVMLVILSLLAWALVSIWRQIAKNGAKTPNMTKPEGYYRLDGTPTDENDPFAFNPKL